MAEHTRERPGVEGLGRTGVQPNDTAEGVSRASRLEEAELGANLVFLHGPQMRRKRPQRSLVVFVVPHTYEMGSGGDQLSFLPRILLHHP